MAISNKTINLLGTVLSPIRDAGGLSKSEFDELMAVISSRKENPSTNKAPSVLLKRKEGAIRLGISQRSFDRLLRDGTFHPVRVGKRSVRVSNAEIENFIQNEVTL